MSGSFEALSRIAARNGDDGQGGCFSNTTPKPPPKTGVDSDRRGGWGG